MTKDELSLISVPILCECCKKNNGSQIKGGELFGVHGLWFLCKECMKLIKERRWQERRSNE
jgi:hypothetical protein